MVHIYDTKIVINALLYCTYHCRNYKALEVSKNILKGVGLNVYPGLTQFLIACKHP